MRQLFEHAKKNVERIREKIYYYRNIGILLFKIIGSNNYFTYYILCATLEQVCTQLLEFKYITCHILYKIQYYIG